MPGPCLFPSSPPFPLDTDKGQVVLLLCAVSSPSPTRDEAFLPGVGRLRTGRVARQLPGSGLGLYQSRDTDPPKNSCSLSFPNNSPERKGEKRGVFVGAYFPTFDLLTGEGGGLLAVKSPSRLRTLLLFPKFRKSQTSTTGHFKLPLNL